MKFIKVLNKAMCVWGYICATLTILYIGTMASLLVIAKPIHPQNPEDWKLDLMILSQPEFGEFGQAFREFYTALKNKDWETTYDFRTHDFRHDVSRESYLASMRKEGSRWQLSNHKVCDIMAYDTRAVRLIMEFDENGSKSYNVVWWKKEDGRWLCQEAGPRELPFFCATRSPSEIQ